VKTPVDEPTDDLVECRVGSCPTRHPADYAMCSRHWRRVPGALRRRVWDLYRTAPGGTEHLAALEEAWEAAGDWRPAGGGTSG
jgi:hypothetical protein